MLDGTVDGIPLVIGARAGALASPREVLTSQSVKDPTAGSGLVPEGRCDLELKAFRFAGPCIVRGADHMERRPPATRSDIDRSLADNPDSTPA
jgi:hypothetical protein